MSEKDFLDKIDKAISSGDFDQIWSFAQILEKARQKCDSFFQAKFSFSIQISLDTQEIVWVDPAVEPILGFDPLAIINQPVTLLHPEEIHDKIAKKYRLGIHSQDILLRNISLRKQDGGHLTAICHGTLLPSNPPIVKLTFTASPDCGADSYIKKIEESVQKLHKAERNRNEFLNNISHELHSRISAILGYNSLLNERMYGTLTVKQEKTVNRIEENANHLLSLSNQLLHLARLEAGTSAFYPEPVNLVKTMEIVLKDFQKEAEAKGLLVELKYPPEVITFTADPEPLQDLFRQIISNAMKFTEEGHISIELWANKQEAKLTIEDTGQGLDSEFVDEFFGQGTINESILHLNKKGAGVGLAIIKKTAALLGIQLEVESHPGYGTTYILHFTAGIKTSSVIPTKEELLAPLNQGIKLLSKGDLKTVLLVNDDPYMSDMLNEYLELQKGYRVIKAGSAIHAMIFLAKTKPDVLLVDLSMPAIHDQRIIEYCRELWGGDIPVIVLTNEKIGSHGQNRFADNVTSVIYKENLKYPYLIQKIESCLPQLAIPFPERHTI